MRIGSVPIFYYHSIGNDTAHPWSGLSLPVSVFEKHLRYLNRNGFVAVTISELYNMRDSDIPDKTVALTIDDGYLDNWTIAYPLLKKYGAKATFFINPEFVDPYEGVRPNLEDVWNRSVLMDELNTWGYASWSELKKMSADGTVDIQSHGMTHTSYFCSEKIVDFHHPGDPYYWLEWNLRADKKPYWLEDGFDEGSSYGYPVYEFDMGLLARRYFDDPELAKRLTKYVKENGGKDFFQRDGWRDLLWKFSGDYILNHKLNDRRETDEEYRSRVLAELIESRKEIERNIGKEVRFISWPNGGYSEQTHRMAIEAAGYFATVASGKYPLSDYSKLLKRVSFGEGYNGPCKDFVHYMKFISAVESLSGSGLRHNLIRIYQRSKVSSVIYRFLRRFF